MPDLSVTRESYSPDQVLGGEFPRAMETVTIASGQNLAANSVLGKVTTGGKYVLSLSASNDGSQVPVAVLTEAVDATGGDKKAGVWLTGEFIGSRLVFGTGHSATTAATLDALKGRSIYIKSAVAAGA